MNRSCFAVLCVVCLLFLSALASGQEDSKVTIKQGATGHVRFWEGDFMPRVVAPGSVPVPSGSLTPVVREIFFYQAVRWPELKRKEKGTAPFYEEPGVKLVKKVTSDADGFFQVELAAGKYSVFIKEDQGYYASRGDGRGFVNPVEITEGKITKLALDIKYKSVW